MSSKLEEYALLPLEYVLKREWEIVTGKVGATCMLCIAAAQSLSPAAAQRVRACLPLNRKARPRQRPLPPNDKASHGRDDTASFSIGTAVPADQVNEILMHSHVARDLRMERARQQLVLPRRHSLLQRLCLLTQ